MHPSILCMLLPKKTRLAEIKWVKSDNRGWHFAVRGRNQDFNGMTLD